MKRFLHSLCAFLFTVAAALAGWSGPWPARENPRDAASHEADCYAAISERTNALGYSLSAKVPAWYRMRRTSLQNYKELTQGLLGSVYWVAPGGSRLTAEAALTAAGLPLDYFTVHPWRDLSGVNGGRYGWDGLRAILPQMKQIRYDAYGANVEGRTRYYVAISTQSYERVVELVKADTPTVTSNDFGYSWASVSAEHWGGGDFRQWRATARLYDVHSYAMPGIRIPHSAQLYVLATLDTNTARNVYEFAAHGYDVTLNSWKQMWSGSPEPSASGWALVLTNDLEIADMLFVEPPRLSTNGISTGRGGFNLTDGNRYVIVTPAFQY